MAMYIARYLGQVPPKELYHDPLLKNKDDETVAMISASRGTIPSKEWMHDINL